MIMQPSLDDGSSSTSSSSGSATSSSSTTMDSCNGDGWSSGSLLRSQWGPQSRRWWAGRGERVRQGILFSWTSPHSSEEVTITESLSGNDNRAKRMVHCQLLFPSFPLSWWDNFGAVWSSIYLIHRTRSLFGTHHCKRGVMLFIATKCCSKSSFYSLHLDEFCSLPTLQQFLLFLARFRAFWRSGIRNYLVTK